MAKVIDRNDWKEFLRNFSTTYAGKKTRLGIFEIRDGVVNDLWIEDGLPLRGVDIDTKGEKQTIGLVFDHFRHSIENVSTLSEVNDASIGGGLDIRDDEGKTTALRFEDDTVESED